VGVSTGQKIKKILALKELSLLYLRGGATVLGGHLSTLIAEYRLVVIVRLFVSTSSSRSHRRDDRRRDDRRHDDRSGRCDDDRRDRERRRGDNDDRKQRDRRRSRSHSRGRRGGRSRSRSRSQGGDRRRHDKSHNRSVSPQLVTYVNHAYLSSLVYCGTVLNYGTFVPKNFCFQIRKFHRWNFCSLELSSPRVKLTWNYMISILYDLNPKRISLQASPGHIQVVTVTSCDPFNQRAPHAGML